VQQEAQPQAKFDLFLSYCHEDRDVAEEFIKRASERGLDVWYDRYIEGGRDWRNSIVDALTRSSALLILFSQASNQSTQLIKEIAIADRGGKLVIPVLIDDTAAAGWG
jgi:hypothetical protein